MAQNSTPPQVAREATQTSRDLGGTVTLIGTFGSSADLHALLKLSNGKTTSVARGDQVNGQTVVAIETGRVALLKNGATEWLEMPAPAS